MKREIKFRAWNPDDLKMEYPLVFAFCMDGNFKPLIKCADGNMAYKDYPIMQFTGLTDKNGKEIYEGDLVKSKAKVPHREGQTFTNVVYWLKYRYRIKGKIYSADLTPNKVYNQEIEVIGNIYENPELL